MAVIDRGGVTGQHALRAKQVFELREQSALGLQVFNNGLDHQLGAARVGQAVYRVDALQQRGQHVGAELAFGDQAFQPDLQRSFGRLGGAGAGIHEGDAVPRLGRHLGNARAHDASANDQYLGLRK